MQPSNAACLLVFVVACGATAPGGSDPLDEDATTDHGEPDEPPVPPDAGVEPDDELPTAKMPARTQTRTCRFGASSPSSLTHDATASDIPARLSEAHCFADLPSLTPGPDLLPYELNAPLWTDGADKHRYIVLPPGRTVTVHDDGRWQFPVGAAILKSFAFEVDDALVPVELRVMVRREGGWQFATYEFDADGGDASLTPGGYDVEVDLGVGQAQRYYFPDDDACRICHRDEDARDVLGPRTMQLDRWFDYGGVARNQIDAMFEAGWIDRAPVVDEADKMPALDDTSAPIEARARAYLHGNCSHCHRPGGWQPIGLPMDLRYETPLAQTAICDERLAYTSPWAGGTRRIAPGDLEDSNIFQRMSLRGDGQMPLFATFETDPLGLQLVADWIEQLSGCPGDD